MPRGYEGFKKAAKAQDDAKGSGDFKRFNWLKLKDGDSARIRILDWDNVAYAHVHPVQIMGRAIPLDIPCRNEENDNTPCPGCEARLPRRMKFYATIIWYDGNVLSEDRKSVVGTADQVAIHSAGRVQFDRLDEVNEDFPLSEYDLSISRTGSTKDDTKYRITSYKEEGEKAKARKLSDADKKLIEEGQPDTGWYVTVPTYDEWVERAGGSVGSSSQSSESQERPQAPWSGGGSNRFANAV